MEWIKKLKINQKLYLMMAMAIFSLIVLGSVGFFYIQKGVADMTTLYKDRTLPIAWFSDIKESNFGIVEDLLGLIVTNGNSGALLDDISQKRSDIDALWVKYEATKLDPYEITNLKKYKDMAPEYLKVQNTIIGLATSNKKAEAMQYYQKNKPMIVDIENTIMGLSDYNVKVADDINTQNDKDAAMSNIIMVSTNVLSIVFLLIVGIMISNMITNPIRQAISNLTEGTDEVSSAASQVASASQQLAEGTSEQAAAIQETSSTLEETSSMVHQNRENTQEAASLAKQAKQYAEKSNDEMGRMSTSMQELKNSSNEIAKIIKVIDEIAFQTNILSLNAAVEAARAGDAGKGFAVVAEEVRNLAQRSAQAAKDTAVIIESNINLSDNSADIAKNVKESVELIGDQSKKVSELLDEISVATNEQAQGVEQINKAVSQMEIVLSTNAQTAEEAAAASRTLEDQAVNVNNIVDSLVVLVDGEGALRAKGRGY